MSATDDKTTAIRFSRRGRLLCDELQERFCDYIRQALAIEVACDLTGIGRQTYYDWKHRGEKEEEAGTPGRYAQFLHAVRAAEAEAIAHLTAEVRKSRPEWLLERRWPAMFGQKLRTEVTGPDGSPIQTRSAQIQVIIREAAALPERTWETIDHADLDQTGQSRN